MECCVTTPWRTAWITGASSGIGRALCIALAREGVRVAASARSTAALAQLAADHPGITPYPLDVTDRAAVNDTVDIIERDLGPIDLAILNAGIGYMMSAARFDAGKAADVMAVNYLGVASGVEAAVRHMVPRARGHIAIVASVAGYRGLPRAGAYNASKAAAIALAEALQPDLARHGVAVSLINPGFVETAMTARNNFPMPFMIGADDAARRIIRGLERRKFEIVFPWQMMLAMKLMRLLPYPLFFMITRQIAAARPSEKQPNPPVDRQG